MQFLQDIIGLSYFQFYPAIEKFLPPGAKNQQLYLAVRDGEVTTDDEARRLIYGSQTAGKKYDMLKKRLKQQVADHYLLLLSQSEHAPSRPFRHQIDSLKQLIIARTLISQGRYKLARQLLHQQQQLADAQLDLTVAQDALQLLCKVAGYQGDRTRFRKYHEAFRKVSHQAYHLRQIQGFYETVRMEHRRRWIPAASVVKLIQSFLDDDQQPPQSEHHPVGHHPVGHPTIVLYHRTLKLMLSFHQGKLKQFRRLLMAQKQQNERYSALHTYDQVVQADLLAMSYLNASYTKDVPAAIEEVMQSSRDESLPVAAWHTLREVECLHWLRQAEYGRAQQIIRQLVDEDSVTISPHDQGRWLLFQAFIQYLAQDEEDQSVHNITTLESALQPVLTDTVGYGWQWTLLKILLWIDHQFLPVRTFLPPIDAFAQRHLSRQSDRTARFFQQLRTVIGQIRDQKQASHRQEDLALPAPTARDRLQEIVPYETLWQTMLARINR